MALTGTNRRDVFLRDNKPKPARRHHVVPRFYLRMFTTRERKKDLLWVIDKTTGKRWKATPDSAGHHKDYYKVEYSPSDPNTIEMRLGEIEAKASGVLREIVSNGQMPSGEDYDNFMAFVALMAVRIPGVRNIFSKGMEQVAKMMLRMTYASRDRFETTREAMKRDGVHMGNEISYEQMKEFVESDRYKIEMSQNWNIGIMLGGMKTIYPLLFSRKWMVVSAKSAGAEFVCSDRPVTLIWTTKVPAFYAPGFGMPSTEVVMPLSRNTAIAGSFEGSEGTYAVNERIVAALNSRTAGMSERFIYSAKEDFNWLKADGTMAGRDDFIISARSMANDENGE